MLVGVIYGPSYLSFDFVLAWYGLIPETVQTFTSAALNMYYPESGTVVNPRPAMILKTAPNMDNAKAFVDFLFSDGAQKMVADAYLLPGRSDVQCENRTNLSDIPTIPTDWEKMMSVASDIAAKLNSLCK